MMDAKMKIALAMVAEYISTLRFMELMIDVFTMQQLQPAVLLSIGKTSGLTL
jgi:hypothetical protein